MRHLLLAIAALATLAMPHPLGAQEENIPNASFGFTGHTGYYNAWQRKGGAHWRGAIGYGGGLVFETMFTNRFGVHSGVGFTRTEISRYSDSPPKCTVEYYTLDIPLYLMVSFNAARFSFILLSGFSYSQMLYAHTKTDDESSSRNSADLLPYINHTNVGVSGGMIFKIRVSRFSDFYVGGIAIFYFTDIFERSNGDIAHFYNTSVVAGYLFRTNIFPMR